MTTPRRAFELGYHIPADLKVTAADVLNIDGVNRMRDPNKLTVLTRSRHNRILLTLLGLDLDGLMENAVNPEDRQDLLHRMMGSILYQAMGNTYGYVRDLVDGQKFGPGAFREWLIHRIEGWQRTGWRFAHGKNTEAYEQWSKNHCAEWYKEVLTALGMDKSTPWQVVRDMVEEGTEQKVLTAFPEEGYRQYMSRRLTLLGT